MIGLLSDYMCSIVDHANGLLSVPAIVISTVLEQLFIAALNSTSDAIRHAAVRLGELVKRRALKYIERNLFSAERSPDRIAVVVSVSRRKLCQLFESEVRIARHVKGLRLDRARAQLAGRYRSAIVKEVALSHGFQSEANFARSFKGQFHHSPWTPTM